LVGSRQGAEYRAGQLRRKLELAANSTVIFLVKAWNTSVFRFEHLGRDMVTGSKKLLAKLIKLIGFPHFYLDGSSCFHPGYLFLKNTEMPLFIFNYFLKTNIIERTAIPPRH
jgi:hypothetical protein